MENLELYTQFDQVHTHTHPEVWFLVMVYIKSCVIHSASG
jgi:cupin superfamily acireductone dioxygenase involved in methionine salvage